MCNTDDCGLTKFATSVETGLLSRVGDTNRFEDLGKVVRDDS